MKKVFASLLLLILIGGLSTIYAQPSKPKLAGHTYTNKSTGETLDFYDNYVVYKAPDAPYSRKGDYTIGEFTNIGTPKKCRITVNIPISDRTKTLKGEIIFYDGTKPEKIVLDGSTYVYSY